MEQQVNFALLGCGRIARKHARTMLNSVPDGRLVAVCDIQKENAESFGEEYGVPSFDSLDAMMAECGDTIDVVNVLTPTGMHPQHVVDVAAHGKHVVVEKPMALTLTDAETMVQACDRAGVRLFVVKQNRYNLPVQRLHEAIQAGRFGKIVMATARVRWCRDQAYYDQDKWRGTWRWDGGVFANQASHHIDLLHWLVGDVDSVFSYTERQLVDIEAEDSGIALLRFRNGGLGVLEATTAARPKDLEASISIMGEKGTAEIGGYAVNELTTWQFAEPLPEDEEIRNNSNQNPPDVYGFGHVEYLKHVVDVVLEGGPAFVDGIEGMKSLRLISALYESAASGKEVSLRFEPRYSRLGMKMDRRNNDLTPELEASALYD